MKNNSKKKQFKVSFVLPVYNTEDYVAETIESIINQDIGFEENCELVIVDDGSTDRSGEICKKYKKKYPNNIQYIKQSNQGVASACNKGLSRVGGEYISFIGSDDRISLNMVGEVLRFFEKHYKEIDLVSTKTHFFGAKQGEHILSYKYTHDHVVDVDIEHQKILTTNGGIFFKKSVIYEVGKMKNNLRTNEDTEFTHRVLMLKKSYGILKKPTYYYRRRIEGNSLVNTEEKSGWWYKTPTETYMEFVRVGKTVSDNIPKYTQYLVMYFLQWHLRKDKFYITGNEFEKYKNDIKKVIKYIDDDVILSQRDLNIEYKIYALSLKYEHDIKNEIEYNSNGLAYFNNLRLMRSKKQTARIEFVYIEQENLVIEGWYGGFRPDQLNARVVCRGIEYKLKPTQRPFSSSYSLGEEIYKKNSFIVKIPLNKIGKIKFYTQNKNLMNLAHWQFSRLTDLPDSYRVLDGYILRPGAGTVSVSRYSVKRHVKSELKYIINTLFKHKKYSLVLYRLAYYLIKLIMSSTKKETWVISDRPYTAGDNGTYLWNYTQTLKNNNTNIYFALNKKAKMYRSLKKYGKIINYGGTIFNITMLFADKRISSMFDQYVINPFGEDAEYMRDLFKFDFIYISHGIASADLSRQLGRQRVNATLMTTGAENETKMFTRNKKFNYMSSQIVTTGMPRFDNLKSYKKEKTIILMPSWRYSLSLILKPTQGIGDYNEAFKSSEYFFFYNRLINDDRIKQVLKDKKYKLKFYIHPNFSSNWIDFNKNEFVEIMRPPHDYVKSMSEASLMITDYSGVQYDFAYMKRPIIYTQYDSEEFHNNHYYEKDKFDYNKHAFGVVAYDYEQAIDEIVKSINNDCKMPIKYQKRVDKFFYKIDKNNSKRVYEAILNSPNNA